METHMFKLSTTLLAHACDYYLQSFYRIPKNCQEFQYVLNIFEEVLRTTKKFHDLFRCLQEFSRVKNDQNRIGYRFHRDPALHQRIRKQQMARYERRSVTWGVRGGMAALPNSSSSAVHASFVSVVRVMCVCVCVCVTSKSELAEYTWRFCFCAREKEL